MSEEREQLEARIAAYIDGELPESEAARLEVFLANTDPQLAEQVIGMMGDKQRVRGLPRPAAPADFVSRVMERVERATLLNDVEHLSESRRSWWQSRAATAAAVLVLVGGFSYLVINAVMKPGKPTGWTAGSGGSEESRIVPGPVADGRGDALRDHEGVWGKDASGALKDGDGGALAQGAPPPNAGPGSVLAGGKAGEDGGHMGALASAKSASGGMGSEMKKGADEHAAMESAKEEMAVQDQLTKSTEILNGAADAGKNGYVSAESAAKALSSLSVSGSMAATKPIVVTLVAQDNQDLVKLRGALEGLMASDATASRQKPLLARYAGFNGQLRGNAVAGNVNLDNPINNATAPTSGQTFSNAGNSVALNNEGYLIYNSGQFDAVETNLSNGNKARGQAVNNRINSEQYQNQSGARAGQFDSNSTNNLTRPYRVMLREDQLQQLAGRFRVYSLSCGPQKFVINEPAPRLAMTQPMEPLAARASDKPTDKQEVNSKMGIAPGASSAVGPVTPAAPATVAPVEESAKPGRQEHGHDRPQAPAEQQRQASDMPKQQTETREEKFKWLDCVIRMEAAPVRGNTNGQSLQQSPGAQQAK